MQIEKIVSGELTYFVVEGEAEITRSGEQTTVYPGDSLVEPEGMVHFGQNQGSQPVVLLSSSLFSIVIPL